MWDVFEWAASSSSALMVVNVLAIAAVVYAGCALVDSVRRYLFKLMNVERGARAVTPDRFASLRMRECPVPAVPGGFCLELG